MNEPDVMVYLMTGFLDSGKSQFLKFTLTQDYFQIDGMVLMMRWRSALVPASVVE